MKIKSIKLKNFRSYKDEIKIDFDDLTVIVGKNDIGKSTILDALDIFFNDGSGVIKIDKNDCNVESVKTGDTETIISVCFSELPNSIVIDSNEETTLKDEYMLNSNGCLEIIKKYKNGGKANVFIKANHPTNSNCSDLLLKKNADLKAIIVKNNIACDNQKVNSVMRKAIWNNCDDLKLQEIEIDASKEDAKKVWEKLVVYMPVYSLFQSDRENSDSDNEVQDPLKEAVKQIISDVKLQEALTKVADEVNGKLREVSERTLNKLREMDPNIANSLNPVIPTSDKLKWADVFKAVSISGDNDIPINKRGSGVKRLVLLNFFRAQAEQKKENGDSTGIIYAVEEPETSQHFDNQRMLINAFKELAEKGNVQVILTTHSPIIVKELDYNNIRLIYDNNGKKEVIKVEEKVLQYPSLNEVIYTAYGEASEEYHDELYAYLEENKLLDDYKQGKQLIKYKRVQKDGTLKDEQRDLTHYIRDQIHHPENTHNTRFTRDELKKSICDMRDYIKNHPRPLS